MKYIIYSILLFSVVYAQPNPTGFTGTLSHGSSVIISGSSFGTKSPAAPLIWDDCEGKTINNENAVFSSGWNDLWPIGSVDSCKIRYRSNGFRGIAQAHSNSTQNLAGCHYQDSDNNPPYIGGAEAYRNVMVTIDAGVAAAKWYARFYYRLDTLWNRQEMNYNNHKVTVFQTGGAGYTPSGGFQYIVYENGATGQSPGVSNLNDNEIEPNSNEFDNARLGWIIWEETLNTGDLDRNVFVNNTDVGFTTSYSEATARSFTMGGYYRRVQDGGSLASTSDYRGSWENDQDTNWRYFDDAYIDTTWSRVILGDQSTYSACTIIEPQPPTAWGSSSITVTVNLGALSDTSYIYVFDDAGNYNSSGLLAEISASTTTNKVVKIIEVTP